MTPAEWSAVKEILGAALECPPEDRSAFLERSCAGDENLRRHVESLIEADERPWRILEAPAAASSSITADFRAPVAGERIGAYEVIAPIGQGGMGVVYLARRADEQFEQRVAIKLSRAGIGGDALDRRFRAERQIVAALDHPHIARLLDGGATPDGRPYLVMEYVEGRPLTEWCDVHGLGTVERLAIFLEVCAAVQYAHQHLVVHRDLKPANILVTEQGSVKLLDFGIAKLIEPDSLTGQGPQTATLFRLMTPDYASPEQVRGERISTSSDVYALGVVLYELLVGDRPYRVSDTAPAEMLRIVCDEQPAKPSAVATPSSRSKELAGDLDTIVLTALRKEPSRRYSTVGAMADDIRRHLGGLPVEARTDAFGYRAGKFVRRHRVAVLAAVLLVAALAAGLAMTEREARRARAAEGLAENRFQDVRNLANVFLFEIHDQIRDLPGSTPARQTLVKRALEYLTNLSRQREGDRALTLDLARAYQRVGDVQGNPYQPNLGDFRGAAMSYSRSIALLFSQTSSGSAEEKQALAKAHFSLGGLEVAMGNPVAGAALSRQGLAALRDLAAARPDDLSRAQALATGMRFHAFSLNAARRGPEALALLVEQGALLRRLLRASPRDKQILREMGQNLYLTGTTRSHNGDDAGARESLSESVDVWRSLVTGNPSSPDMRRGLFWALTDDAALFASPDQLPAGLSLFDEAREVARSLVQGDPKNTDARMLLAIACVNVAVRATQLGNYKQAASDRTEARTLLESIVAVDPSNPWAAAVLGGTYAAMAEDLVRAGNRKAACEFYRKSLDSLSRLQVASRLTGDAESSMERARKGAAACGQPAQSPSASP